MGFLQKMYIEIYQDVIEDAIKKRSQTVNVSLDLLLLFGIFSQKGTHIIYVPCLAKNGDLLKSLHEIMSRPNVQRLRAAENKAYLLPTIKDAISSYCVVTYSNNSVSDSKAIIINPAQMGNFEPYLETRMITENLLDSLFFRFVAKYYCRSIHLDGIRFNFDPIPGGGSTTYEAVRSELNNKRRFILVIVDSDKKYPTQIIEKGSTADKILEVKNSFPSCLCEIYIMQNVMEVENLIPKKIVSENAANKSDINMLDKDFSYYDMKCGLTLKGLYKDEVFHYWSEILKDEQDVFCERKIAKDNSSTRDEYEAYIDNHKLKNTIKSGFGSDLLTIVTCTFDNRGHIKNPKLMDEMYNIMPTDLTNDQRIEWNNIGKLVFSWTCGLSERRA